MKRFELTVPNSIYGDRVVTAYKFDMTVGSFTFEAAVYKLGKTWTVCLASNAAFIAQGDTRKEAIDVAQERLDQLGDERVKWSVEQWNAA